MSKEERLEELIAEAREHWVELNGHDSRAAEVLLELADALEESHGERDDALEALAAVARVREIHAPFEGEGENK